MSAAPVAARSRVRCRSIRGRLTSGPHTQRETAMKNIRSVLVALSVALVLGTYIAVAQHFISRRQYRLALFERRMVVYNSTMNLMASVLQSTKPSFEQVFQYLRETRDHEFLFGPEVGTFITEVYNKAVELNAHNEMGSQAATQKAQVLNWFIEQMGEARKVFLRYLDFKKP